VPFYRRKNNCIENKTNAKSASEIGFVNKPLIALLDVFGLLAPSDVYDFWPLPEIT
jgi:hypothetical protein